MMSENSECPENINGDMGFCTLHEILGEVNFQLNLKGDNFPQKNRKENLKKKPIKEQK